MSYNGSQPLVAKAPFEAPIAKAKDHDQEAICSIARIREHTKTDDIPHVTDEQLRLYRRAAFESAEHYAGLLLVGTRQVEEVIKLGSNYSSRIDRKIKHTLRYRPSQAIAYIYGPGLSEVIRITEGKRKLLLPNMFQSSDWNSCCNPCASGLSDFKILYTAGYGDCDEIPAGIIVGVLKWITWSIFNPGDTLKTIDNERSTSSRDGLTGTNNVAWASGALEMWREYNNDAY